MFESNRPSNTPSLSVLHHSDTDMGLLMLRKRWSLALERDVFEMTMDGKLMMSSAISISERALAERALALLPDRKLRVLVGGLGFGFTALAALADQRVEHLTIIEVLGQVVEWHRQGIFPWSGDLLSNPNVTVLTGDFFAVVMDSTEAAYDAILIDIDDSPRLLWHHRDAAFYEVNGLEAVKRQLRPEGVLALWSATHPGKRFVKAAEAAFESTEVLEVQFENPCHRRWETNYLLLAMTKGQEEKGQTRE